MISTWPQKAFISCLLAPLVLLYAGGKLLHRRLWLRPKLRNHDFLLPLIVIGSLRAGGSGKTPVAGELSRVLARQGRRVGILVYRLQKHEVNERDGLKWIARDLAEINPESDWRYCSDEAVLLARESGARVFATRNREQAWDDLSRMADLDLLISDDGIMDPRLEAAFRVVLREPGETPRWFDLLPAGPYHLTSGILKKVDCVCGFQRELIFPNGFAFNQTCWALCGIGNPEAFRHDLLKAGVLLAGMSAGPDHGLPNLGRARKMADLKKAKILLCTSKDWIKLENKTAELGPVIVVKEGIGLKPDLILAVEQYLRTHASS